MLLARSRPHAATKIFRQTARWIRKRSAPSPLNLHCEQAMIDFQNIEDAQTLAQAIVNTIPEPFIVLDDQFCVLPFLSTREFEANIARSTPKVLIASST
ncbi:hypothetical protein [Rhizobium gallicum]|uniref:hypothetical protein n=1 Tax=Rhizobium gallicum TaxID=56730 RepID=UPI00142D592F|nr:hypothetical protein [Rhizobium gallicum]